MALSYKSVLTTLCSLTALTGCGGSGTPVSKATPPTQPTPACTGTIFTGTLHDSLTFQPVPQAQIVLEAGTPGLTSFIYTFNPTAQTTSAPDGTFQLCAASLPTPSILVITALDKGGKAYPPYATNRFAAASLGTLLMGSCTTACIDAQQQSTAPVTIAGLLSTDPVAESGTWLPQQAIAALDGSRNIWNLLIPPLNPTQPLTFQTATTAAAGSPCAGQSSPCAAYSFVLPTEQPVIATASGTSQQAGGTGYSIEAQIGSQITGQPAGQTTGTCNPPSLSAFLQADGTTPLLATPGAQLTAKPIGFGSCR